MKAILVLLACATPAWSEPDAAEGRLSGSAISKTIDPVVRKAQQAWQVPGLAVGIVRKGKVIYLKGHGVRALAPPPDGANPTLPGEEQPVTPNTLFPIASCTKAFTTTLLAQLVDEGKLSWDDHPRKHVPSFRLADPLADREVTLRDLLCHRTGLAGHDWLWHRAPWSIEESIQRAGLLPLDKPFRSAFQYQSIMFRVAGLAAARAGGAPWDQLVRKRLLEPLGMNQTVFTTRSAGERERASGHCFSREGQVVGMADYVMDQPDPAGSIYTSARDLCRWMQFQLDEGKVAGRPLVSADVLGETFTPQMVIALDDYNRRIHAETVQLSYGLGWVIHDYRGRSLRSHAGFIDGFRVHITLVPSEGLGLVLLNNLHRTQMNQALCNSLLDLLLDVPRPRRDWNAYLLHLQRVDERSKAEAGLPRLPNTRPSLPLADYTGKYQHPAFGTVTIGLDRQTLTWSWGKTRSALEHWHFDTFLSPLPVLNGVPLVFRLDRTGRVAALHWKARNGSNWSESSRHTVPRDRRRRYGCRPQATAH